MLNPDDIQRIKNRLMAPPDPNVLMERPSDIARINETRAIIGEDHDLNYTDRTHGNKKLEVNTTFTSRKSGEVVLYGDFRTRPNYAFSDMPKIALRSGTPPGIQVGLNKCWKPAFRLWRRCDKPVIIVTEFIDGIYCVNLEPEMEDQVLVHDSSSRRPDMGGEKSCAYIPFDWYFFYKKESFFNHVYRVSL